MNAKIKKNTLSHKIITVLERGIMSLLICKGSQFIIRGFFILSLLSYVYGAADCNKETCINGACRLDICECSENFGGEDCSMPYEICPDGKRKCYNGSECRRNHDKDPVTHEHKYSCDCSKAYDVANFAGIQCEYSTTAVCEIGKENSFYSFCTNEGECVEMVNPGRPHQGCRCLDFFEGLHCEYLKGEAPPHELAAVATLEASRTKRSSLSGLAMSFIILVPLVLAGMFAYILYKKKRNEKENFGDCASVSECSKNMHTYDIELKSEIL